MSTPKGIITELKSTLAAESSAAAPASATGTLPAAASALDEEKRQAHINAHFRRMMLLIFLTIVSIGLAAGIGTLLIAKYAQLMRSEDFFVKLWNGSPSSSLSSGEMLFFKFVFEMPGLAFGALFGALGAVLNWPRGSSRAKEL
jgi:hypothetical protein